MSETVVSIPIRGLRSPDRMRPVDEAKAEAMAASMREVGQITPIMVRRRGDSYELLTGSHRLRACQINFARAVADAEGAENEDELPFARIVAVITDRSDDDAALIEIDENLLRADLSALDQADFLRKRQEFFRLNGKVLERNRDGRKNRQVGGFDPDVLPGPQKISFYREIANLIGISERTAQRAIRRSKLPPQVKDAVRARGLADNGSFLDRLVKIETKAPGAIVKELHDGNIKAAATRAAHSMRAPKAVDEAFQSFCAAYRAGEKSAVHAVHAWHQQKEERDD